MLQGHTTAIVPCGNPTPKKLPTGGGEWPTFRTARAQHAHSTRYAPLVLLGHRRCLDKEKGVSVSVGTAGPATGLSFRNKSFTLLDPSHLGKDFFPGKSGTVVPLLTEVLLFFLFSDLCVPRRWGS